MNNKTEEYKDYLQVISEYLLLTETEQYSPKIINKLYENLYEILRTIQGKLFTEEFKGEDCQIITKQIDRLLYLSAELTLIPLENAENELTKFKEKLWHLLETLEEYCKETFELSVW